MWRFKSGGKSDLENEATKNSIIALRRFDKKYTGTQQRGGPTVE
jgi:hypothetical protein